MFGILAYVCSFVHFLYGLIFTAIVITLNEREAAKFTCYVAPESSLVYKTQVDNACYSDYQQKYNAPLPFYLFVILSIWSPIFVAVMYSLCVLDRVDQVESGINATQAEGDAESQGQNTGSSYVYYFYFIHLIIRAVLGILFTILQYCVFFPNGFDFKYNCSFDPAQFTFNTAQNASDSHFDVTSAVCENPSAHVKNILRDMVSSVNTVFALIMVLEMNLLRKRFPKCNYTEFIVVHLLRKQYAPVEQIELTPLTANLQECIHFYKGQVLCSPRSTDVISAPTTSFDDLYVNLVIHSERAPHNFPKRIEQRHQIYDVYMKVPNGSIRLHDVKDLFYPNKDTKGKFPKRILAVGRPGIGKTVLTEKIMRDWAGNRVDECYYEKIAFSFKFRWFNGNEQNAITLKTFLRNGTRLSDEKFDKIYEYITAHPEKTILVFDGLDEFNGNSACLNHLPPPDDPNICMSWISLFIKLISRCFLPEATILVTSRPTAHEFYSRFSFDRSVEIIGFTEDKIEEFVQKLCDNNGKSSLKPKIWDKIKSTSDILKVCYIPVNCWIVSTILFECFKDPESDCAPVPTTLTELYQEAITHLDKHHFRKFDAEANKKLQLLAFKGVERGQLVFPNESFDEQMRKSGFLNKLYNPYSQARQQFCFIHLTIQEFLAAEHVTETFTPEEIHEFVKSHVTSGKWHLVLQFIAGLLGKKMTKSFETCYVHCVLAFGGCLVVKNGILDLADDTSLCVIKCLREFDDENLIEISAEAPAMNDVISLTFLPKYIPAPQFGIRSALLDWEAVAFVCKHMKNLMSLDIRDFNVYVAKLLEQRCMKKLRCSDANVKGLFPALLKSSCTVKHEHTKITELDFSHSYISDDSVPVFSSFFKNGHAHYLEKLVLTL